MKAPEDLGGFISDVGDVLKELSIDYGTVQSIITGLEAAVTELPSDKQMQPIPDGAFSSLPAGSNMTFHTNNAQTYLLSVMTEMMEMLGLYRDGVVAYKAGSTTTDEFSAAELSKINQATEMAATVNGLRVPQQQHPQGSGS